MELCQANPYLRRAHKTGKKADSLSKTLIYKRQSNRFETQSDLKAEAKAGTKAKGRAPADLTAHMD